MLLVIRIDAQFHAGNCLAAGALFECLPAVVSKDRSAFGHSVAYCVGEMDGAKETFHFLIQCCSSDNQLFEVATEGIHYFLSDGLTDFIVDKRDVHQQFHVRLLYRREYFLFDDFFNNQRYGDDDVRLHFCKGIRNHFG